MLKKVKYILDRKQKINLIFLLLIILGGAFMELLGVSAILPLINVVLDANSINQKWYFILLNEIVHFENAKQMILFLSCLLVVIYIAKNLYIIFMYNAQYKFIFENQKNLAVRMLNCYMKQDYLFHVSKNVADLQRNISSDVNGFFTVVLNLLQFIAEISVCVVLAIFLMMTDITTTIAVALLMSFFVLFFNKVFQKLLVSKGEKNRQINGKLNKWILQSFAGIKEIKVTNKEDFFLENYNDNYNQFANLQRQQSLLTLIPRPIMETVCIGGLLVTLSMKVYMGGSDLDSFIPIMSVFAIAAFRMLPSFNRMTGYLGAMLFSKPSVDALYKDLQDVETLLQTTATETVQDKAEISHFDNIEIENLSFKYPNTDKWILHNAELVIPRNTSIAIIGESGAGKTTLVDILLGILRPNNGTIMVNNVNVWNCIHLWHEYIGYIPQNIYLMDDSIRANIAFGIPKNQIDEKIMQKVIREAQLEEYVSGLDYGLDTKIGDRGVRISGGQRQRIGIARALYRQPQILILDEATSALDNETEKAVMEAIDNLQGSKTMIIIAHRLTTIRNCDSIYEVKDGKIITRNKEELFA